MTVIATDGHTMAGDGLVGTGYTIISLDHKKVERLEDGRVVGSSGSAADCLAFVAWLRDPSIAEPKLKSMTALVLNPDGSIQRYDEGFVPLNLTAPQSIGCGSDIALGAMDLGASPKRAVEIACQRSMACGGTIMVVARGDLS